MKSESIRTLFFQLTLYLELFTHIVPVPLMIYFTMVTGGIRETHLLIRVAMAHLLYLSVAPPHWGSHMTIPFLLVMIIPISVMAFLFISENIIRPVLKSGELADVFVDIASIPRLDYSRRIIYVLFSLVLLPSILLGYLLFTVVNKTIVLENIGLHIGIIASLLVIPITMASLHIARALRVGMEDINGVLSELEKGNLSVRSIPATADDFGMEAVYLGKVIDNLREIYRKLAAEISWNMELFQSIAYYYFRYKKYTKASHVAERILERRPDSVDAMTFAALCLEKAGDYQKAAVYRERLRIWNPTDQKNLYLAIRIYRKAGNKKRAIHLSENLERIATGLMNKKIYYFKNKLT